MNRRDRRAAQSRILAAGNRPGAAAQDPLMDMFNRAVQHQGTGELGAAAQLYRKILAARPDHVAACERLALTYLAQGKLDKASEQLAELAHIAPQTLAQFGKVLETLKQLIPALAAELANPKATPEIAPPRNSAAAASIATILDNRYCRTVLESSAVYDGALERWLTALRASILRAALAERPNLDSETLAFCTALARQCFINEYVFAVAPPELELLARLTATVADALSQDAPIQPLSLLALAMYRPLHELGGAGALTTRTWPAPVAAVLTQQIEQPKIEAELRATVLQLTPIGDGVTAQVRQQYEENPYPRWASLAAPPWPLLSLDGHLRRLFPSAAFRPIGHEDRIEILVAGCGTGRHALELAQSFRGARVLAVDLSRASLASAKRRTPPRLAGAIEFAQADIMALGSIGRGFDCINAGGVLHHMPDPWAGWRELIKLMKPNGVMQVGLYSAHARRDIVAARRIIAERGYRATPDDIRRLRHDLMASAENFSFMQLDDFYTVSTCRDLLFHVHEVQTTIPEIKAFLADNGLKFIGFDFGALEGQEHYRSLFARNGWSLGDLDRWDKFERDNPRLFAGMYVFWVQKT
jgi:trans-aconitate methyltransferase